MKKLTFFKAVIIISLLINCAFINLNAQVTIGDNKVSEPFSVLELVSNDTRGMRLPQLTTAERLSISNANGGNPEMMGLTVFDKDTKCVEVWNGFVWIEKCAPFEQSNPVAAATICNGTTYNFVLPDAIGGKVGATITYQWEQSSDKITWINALGVSTNANYATPALTNSTWYRRKAANGIETIISEPSLVTVYDALTAGTISSTQAICANTAPAAFTETAPTGGTGTYTYQWQSSPNGTTWTDISGATSATYTSGALTATTQFRRAVTSGACATVYSPVITITVYANLTAGTISSAQTICYNTTPAAFTQTAPTGGTGTYTYQWQSSPNGTTWTDIAGATSATYTSGALTATTQFRRSVTSGACGTVYSSAITVTVYANLTAGTIGTAQNICANTAPAAFTQTAPTGGTGTYTYQWQSSQDGTNWTNIAGATAATYTSGALTVSTYFRRNVTSGSCGTVSSNSILITVTYVPNQPGAMTISSINADPNIAFTASVPAVAGATYYTWTLTGGLSGSSSTNVISITGTANMSFGAGAIKVQACNNCGCSSPTQNTTAISWGCGAYIAPGVWKATLCYNMGAGVTSWTPAQQVANAPTYTVGDLYQWGRRADGHQSRWSGTTQGKASGGYLDGNGQPAGYFVGAFITNGYGDWIDWCSPQNDYLWNWGSEAVPSKSPNDPCPAGWRIPTASEIRAMMTYNYWQWVGSGTYGYYLKPSAGSPQPTLFMPATNGGRDYRGYFVDPSAVSTRGCYWTSTSYGSWSGNNLSTRLDFDGTTYIECSGGNGRTAGFAIRCVAQ